MATAVAFFCSRLQEFSRELCPTRHHDNVDGFTHENPTPPIPSDNMSAQMDGYELETG